MITWEQEYKRRCLAAVTGYAGDGDEPGIKIDVYGEDGYRYSSWTYEDPSLSITVRGELRSGASVEARIDGPEDVADFIRKVTN